jgi:hypothetical protein
MSAMRHATLTAWSRQEDGSYGAEINGWTLRVKWRPDSPGVQRGFWWEAEQAGKKARSPELHEEIEVAMAHAEEHVAPAVEAPAEKATEADHAHH